MAHNTERHTAGVDPPVDIGEHLLSFKDNAAYVAAVDDFLATKCITDTVAWSTRRASFADVQLPNGISVPHLHLALAVHVIGGQRKLAPFKGGFKWCKEIPAALPQVYELLKLPDPPDATAAISDNPNLSRRLREAYLPSLRYLHGAKEVEDHLKKVTRTCGGLIPEHTPAPEQAHLGGMPCCVCKQPQEGRCACCTRCTRRVHVQCDEGFAVTDQDGDCSYHCPMCRQELARDAANLLASSGHLLPTILHRLAKLEPSKDPTLADCDSSGLKLVLQQVERELRSMQQQARPTREVIALLARPSTGKSTLLQALVDVGCSELLQYAPGSAQPLPPHQLDAATLPDIFGGADPRQHLRQLPEVSALLDQAYGGRRSARLPKDSALHGRDRSNSDVLQQRVLQGQGLQDSLHSLLLPLHEVGTSGTQAVCTAHLIQLIFTRQIFHALFYCPSYEQIWDFIQTMRQCPTLSASPDPTAGSPQAFMDPSHSQKLARLLRPGPDGLPLIPDSLEEVPDCIKPEVLAAVGGSLPAVIPVMGRGVSPRDDMLAVGSVINSVLAHRAADSSRGGGSSSELSWRDAVWFVRIAAHTTHSELLSLLDVPGVGDDVPDNHCFIRQGLQAATGALALSSKGLENDAAFRKVLEQQAVPRVLQGDFALAHLLVDKRYLLSMQQLQAEDAVTGQPTHEQLMTLGKQQEQVQGQYRQLLGSVAQRLMLDKGLANRAVEAALERIAVLAPHHLSYLGIMQGVARGEVALYDEATQRALLRTQFSALLHALQQLARARAKSLLQLVVQSVASIKAVIQRASTGLLQLAERPRSVSSRRDLGSSTWEVLGAELQSLCSPEWMEQVARSSVGAAGAQDVPATPAGGAGSSRAADGLAQEVQRTVQQLAASFEEVADEAVGAVAKRLQGSSGGGQQGLQEALAALQQGSAAAISASAAAPLFEWIDSWGSDAPSVQQLLQLAGRQLQAAFRRGLSVECSEAGLLRVVATMWCGGYGEVEVEQHSIVGSVFSFYTARDRRLQAQLQRALWQAARSVALEHLQQLHAAQVGSSEAVPDYNDVEEAFVEAARDAFQTITDGPVHGVLSKLGYSRSKGPAALQARIEADISALHAECNRVKAQKERAKAGPARDYRYNNPAPLYSLLLFASSLDASQAVKDWEEQEARGAQRLQQLITVQHRYERLAARPQAQLLRRTYADAQLAGALGSCGGSSRRLLCYSEEHFRQLQPAALQQLDQPEHEEALLRALLGTVLVVKGRQAGDGSGAGAGGAAQQAALLRQLQEQQLVAAAMDEALGRRLLPVAGSSAIELAVAPEVRLGLWQHLQLLAARLRMQVQVLVQREGRSGSAAGAATWVVVEPDGADSGEDARCRSLLRLRLMYRTIGTLRGDISELSVQVADSSTPAQPAPVPAAAAAAPAPATPAAGLGSSTAQQAAAGAAAGSSGAGAAAGGVRKRKRASLRRRLPIGEDGNFERCSVCWRRSRRDNDLVCCEGCPDAVHEACGNFEGGKAPEGDWYCAECTSIRQQAQGK